MGEKKKLYLVMGVYRVVEVVTSLGTSKSVSLPEGSYVLLAYEDLEEAKAAAGDRLAIMTVETVIEEGGEEK